MNSEAVSQLAKILQEQHGFASVSQLDKAVADILRRTAVRQASGNTFSLSTMIRGLRAIRHEPINPATADADVQYVRALTTGSTPGSYLVPTIQANEIIQYLTIGGIFRGAGSRIWDLNSVQKLTVPSALAVPSWVWMAQNSVQTPTDPNLGQLSFDLKERRCLVVVPNQLLAVSVPAFDTLLAELIGLGAAEHEDTAAFSTSTVSGGPTALYAASGITTVNVGGSANGGNLAYSDILACMAQMAAQKGKGPFVWFASPRTFYQRILGLVDSQSRPIVVPTATQGLYPAVQFSLMGYPVFVSPAIPENESNGSGTNQSHLIFTNPRYCHIAQDGAVEIAISTERFFDANQTAIRATQHEDFGYAPAQGIVALKGVN